MKAIFVMCCAIFANSHVNGEALRESFECAGAAVEYMIPSELQGERGSTVIRRHCDKGNEPIAFITTFVHRGLIRHRVVGNFAIGVISMDAQKIDPPTYRQTMEARQEAAKSENVSVAFSILEVNGHHWLREETRTATGELNDLAYLLALRGSVLLMVRAGGVTADQSVGTAYWDQWKPALEKVIASIRVRQVSSPN